MDTLFGVNIIFHKLSDTSAKLVRLSLGNYANTMYVNLHETHRSLICDIKAYSHSYRCSKCEHSLCNYPAWLERHELTFEAGVRYVYSGGVYHNTPSVFHRLDDEGITVVDTVSFYPYRATSTSSVSSTERIYLPIACSGLLVMFR